MLTILVLLAVAAADADADPMKLLTQGKYLAALAAAEREAQHPSPFAADTLGAARAAIGDCQGALAAMEQSLGSPEPARSAASPAASPLDGLERIDALEAIIAEAKAHRIVILNEAHHVPMHRAFSLEVARALHEQGFTYFAAETLSRDSAPLAARGYPTLASGFYSLEPVFGDLLRQVLALGYRPIAYETEATSRPADQLDQINARETDQCQNLVDRIFAKDPAAKVLIHVGYSHATEDTLTFAGGREQKWMAARLKAATGLDPLTIDQTEEMEHATPGRALAEWRYAVAKGWLARPAVFRRADGTYFTGGTYAGRLDLQVFHPPSELVDGRPGWLAMRGYRKPVEVPSELEPEHGRILVQAFVARESDDAVPMDQVVVQAGEPCPVLMLPDGDYRLVVQDETGAEIARVALAR